MSWVSEQTLRVKNVHLVCEKKKALHCWCFLYQKLMYLSLNHLLDKQNRVSYEAELPTLQSLSWLLPELSFFKSSEHPEQDFMTHGGLLLSPRNTIVCPHIAKFLCLCILIYFCVHIVLRDPQILFRLQLV